jgi:hypothetical protein
MFFLSVTKDKEAYSLWAIMKLSGEFGHHHPDFREPVTNREHMEMEARFQFYPDFGLRKIRVESFELEIESYRSFALLEKDSKSKDFVEYFLSGNESLPSWCVGDAKGLSVVQYNISPEGLLEETHALAYEAQKDPSILSNSQKSEDLQVKSFQCLTSDYSIQKKEHQVFEMNILSYKDEEAERSKKAMSGGIKGSFYDEVEDKEYSFYLHQLSLFDIRQSLSNIDHRTNHLSEDRLMNDICQEGMDMVVLAYEAQDNVFLSFYSTDFLDKPIHRGNGASAVGVIMGGSADKVLGYRMQTAVLSAVPKDYEGSYHFELMSWSKEVKGEWLSTI